MATMTTRQLAERAGVTQAYIRQLCIRGVIKAEKPGRDWLIPDEEAEHWLSRREKLKKP